MKSVKRWYRYIIIQLKIVFYDCLAIIYLKLIVLEQLHVLNRAIVVFLSTAAATATTVPSPMLALSEHLHWDWIVLFSGVSE